MPVSPTATADTENSVLTCSSVASSPSLLATRIERRLSPYRHATCEMAEPSARAASSAACSRATLRVLATASGATLTSFGAGACWRLSLPAEVGEPPARAAAAAVCAARCRPAGVRSAVWAKPTDEPERTRIPAPLSRPETNSSTLPSSKWAREERRSSTNTSAKSPPVRRADRSVASRTSASGIALDIAASFAAMRRDSRWSRLRGQPGYQPPIPNQERLRASWHGLPPAHVTAPAGTRRVGVVVLEAGARGSAERTVSEADTGASVGSSDFPILATPVLLALSEAATIDALEGRLPGGSTSVSMRVHFDHVRPVPVGRTVLAKALLERVEGRRLTFSVEARDTDGDLVGSGRIVRIVVERQRFVERLPPAR